MDVSSHVIFEGIMREKPVQPAQSKIADAIVGIAKSDIKNQTRRLLLHAALWVLGANYGC